MDFIKMLGMFERKSGLKISYSTDSAAPVALGRERAENRSRLHMEEALEFAMATSVAEQLKELVDLFYVLFGTAVHMGLSMQDLEELFSIVHDANMSKVLGPVTKDANGKVQKGPGYISPMEKIVIWLDLKREQALADVEEGNA